ncbi:DUF2905 domain-containing protein [Arundinibacter roseus]|uniref:DUF2905 domain-containing protein n=1 Tax=Arundinibacter roseus TaxID=2070510 RepID=A0A4R4KIM7_9BACT|nr:DUF2905 domain-containing protein [Arundinibacter roseus]TDB67998.1 DUF2905 domain-containing protein [Arundinibacter roseus]
MNQSAGRYLILAGIVVMLLGILVYFLHDKLDWIGKLPGDIRVEKENFRLYFPITTLVLFSLLLNLIIFLIRRFFS